MRRISFGIVFVAALIGTPALATNVLPDNWTGWYAGGNLGSSWGYAPTNIAETGSVTTFFAFTSIFSVADQNTGRMYGLIGGGQVGYNYQVNRKWVLGIEGDIQGSSTRGSSNFADPYVITVCITINCSGTFPFSGVASTSYQTRIDWFGTLRGRLGFLATDQFLVYGTGGLAYGRVAVLSNMNINGSFASISGFTGASSAFSASKTNVGFVVGGGVEGKVLYGLPANWSWKLEYLYMDLGSLNSATSYAMPPFAVDATPITGTIAMRTHFTDNIVRVGLNYKFK
jgi:outer membrane immunogenic protein